MPLFKVQIFKTQTGDRFWTNVYHVDAADLNAASAFANITIAPAEAGFLDSHFRVVKSLVSDVLNDDFITTPLNEVGALSGSPYLPLFNTAKVNVAVAGFGRNDYKFYRGGATEINVEDGQWTPAAITAYDALVDNLIADGTAAGVDMVDNEGNAWLLAATQPAVQMRQRHRRRARGEPL